MIDGEIRRLYNCVCWGILCILDCQFGQNIVNVIWITMYYISIVIWIITVTVVGKPGAHSFEQSGLFVPGDKVREEIILFIIADI